MQAALLPYLTVYVGNAIRHEWKPGDALLGADAETTRLWLVNDGSLLVRLQPRQKKGDLEPRRNETKEYVLKAGSGLLLPPNSPRDIRTPQGGDWCSVGLTAVLFGTIDLLANGDLPSILTPDARFGPLLQTLLEHLIAEEGGPPPYSPGGVHQMEGAGYLPGRTPGLQREEDAVSLLMRRSLGETIFSLVWRVLCARSGGEAGQWSIPSGASSFAGWPSWLPAVLGEVSRDPALGIEDLARRAGITDVQVRRVFRRYLGVTPSEYLRRARLDAARHLLETTDWTVATITERVGFESPSHFTRLFKSTFGYPPAQHRRLGA